MPWKETCAMDERMRFVMEVQQGELPKAVLCRKYGISRPPGEKWLGRYAACGLPGLLDRSRAPRHHPNEVSELLAEMILAFRRRHPTWGPKKIRPKLSEKFPGLLWPACSTIGEILRRGGLTSPRKRRRRTPPYTQPFGSCRASNAVWCADFKGWFRTADGTRCDPLTISDGYSRYLFRVQGMRETKGDPVRGVFVAAFGEYGLPQAIRTDNGSPFASCGIGGFSRLSVWWLKLGIVPERIAPGHPEQNGRHERMHRTLKAETAAPPARDLRRQQEAFDRFRQEYNQTRPHEALGQVCPATVYVRSPREYVEPVEAAYPSGFEVRSVKGNGVFNWRGQVVFLGEAFGRERVGLTEVGDGCWAVYFCRQALGIVDPRRRKVQDAAEAIRKGMIDESVLRSPFRCAPGTPENPDHV